eukprot:6139701-Pleurochrysis_carterae.AAC.2
MAAPSTEPIENLVTPGVAAKESGAARLRRDATDAKLHMTERECSQSLQLLFTQLGLSDYYKVMCQFASEERELTAVQILLGINVDPTLETTSPYKLQRLHQLLKSKDGHGASQLLPAYEEGDEYEPPLRLSLAVKQLKQNAAGEMALLAKIAANSSMFTPGMTTTPSTTPTADGGYGVDNSTALVNALAPRLKRTRKTPRAIRRPRSGSRCNVHVNTMLAFALPRRR